MEQSFLISILHGWLSYYLSSQSYIDTHEAFKETLNICENMLATLYGVEGLRLWWRLENLKLRF
jgi:hypothetical protein